MTANADQRDKKYLAPWHSVPGSAKLQADDK
jgi:hypothetical protein